MRVGLVLLSIVMALALVSCGEPPPGPAPTPTAIAESPATVGMAPFELVQKVSLSLHTPTPVAATQCEHSGCEVAEANGCLCCHTTDGTDLVGPSWLDLFGKEEELETGVVTVDEAYITESILDPAAKIVKGYDNVMIVVPLTQEEIDEIISYIKTLTSG